MGTGRLVRVDAHGFGMEAKGDQVFGDVDEAAEGGELEAEADVGVEAHGPDEEARTAEHLCADQAVDQVPLLRAE